MCVPGTPKYSSTQGEEVNTQQQTVITTVGRTLGVALGMHARERGDLNNHSSKVLGVLLYHR